MQSDVQVAKTVVADGIPVQTLPTGPRAYVVRVVVPSLRLGWRRIRGKPRLERRRPLRVSGARVPPTARRALMAYLRAPFERPADAATAAHPNWEQALIIADVLGEFGYQVDVVGPLDEPDGPRGVYDVLIGELGAFARCVPFTSAHGRRIYLATRRHPWWEYRSVREHLAEVRRSSGLRLTSPLGRAWYAEAARGLAQADAVISIGSSRCADTYSGEGIPVVAVGNTALLRCGSGAKTKDYEAARRHFLWLGTAPLANKGLAPVLAAFARHPDLHLWVCGPLTALAETRTVWALRHHLFESPNVHPVGWVDVRSDLFRSLLATCGFIVSASYSESMSSSVILGVANGLVPVVTPEVGVECADYGIPVARPHPDDMAAAIRQAASLPPSVLRTRSERANAFGEHEFTPAAFRRRFASALASLLDGPARPRRDGVR